MKIIVTGGAGFIGSHLCDRLIALGHHVLCIDNLSKGNIENIKHLKNNKRFSFLKFDVTKKLPAYLSADQLFHLASMTSPNVSKPKNIHSMPFETMLVNTQGTWNLAEFCIAKGAKFLFASSSDIYGDPAVHPQPEDYNGNISTIAPRSVFCEAKRFGETITAAFVRSKGLDGRIVRIFNTYGSRMALDDGRVAIEFITQALEKKPITIFGNGRQTRSFCFVSDLVEGLIAAMNKKKTTGGVFNLGNPDEKSILDLARIIKRLTDSDSKIVFVDISSENIEEPKRRRPDIIKAKKMLGWQPKIKIDRGLEEMITFVRNQLALKC